MQKKKSHKYGHKNCTARVTYANEGKREMVSLTRPKMGTKWCSHMENMSISFTITISSWSSSKIASFRTSTRRYNNKSRWGEWYDIMKSLYFTPCALPVSFLLASIIARTYPILSIENALSFLAGLFNFLAAYLGEGFRGNMANRRRSFRVLLRCDSHILLPLLCSHCVIEKGRKQSFFKLFMTTGQVWQHLNLTNIFLHFQESKKKRAKLVFMLWLVVRVSQGCYGSQKSIYAILVTRSD